MWDFCAVSLKKNFSPLFLLNDWNMDKMAGAPAAIPDQEVTLRIEASAKDGRAERKALMPSRILGHKDNTQETNQNNLDYKEVQRRESKVQGKSSQ